MNTDAIAAAQHYGWPIIKLSKPTDSGPSPGKRPLGRNWETKPGLSEAEATQWLADGGNIGIRTGGGLLVVDCDGDRPPNLPDTPTVQTGSGGLHLYYRVPDGTTFRHTGNTARWIHPTTDTRYERGQVVAAGSIHAETGVVYEWLPGLSPAEMQLTTLPQWVIDAINNPTPPPWHVKPGTPADPRRAAPVYNHEDRYIAAAVSKAIANVINAPEGQRNHTLNKEAFALAGLPGVDATGPLMDAALVSGLTEQESRASIRSGTTAGREKPRQIPAAKPVTMREITETLKQLPDEAPFQVLGHYAGKYYFLPADSGQVVDLSPTAMAQEPNLYRLAEKTFWETKYTDGNGKASPKEATNALIFAAHKRGLFDKSRIRGRGAWHDKNRIVLHRGTSLLVDGQETPLAGIKSRNIYQHEREIAIPYQNPLSVDEARDGVLALCNMLCWERSIYGNLLAGWLALAPICGVLDWRPHIWITGQSGTGKSYIQDEIIPILGSMVIFVQGCSTEAGVRQMLNADALAVSFDESEPDGFKATTRIGHILELARQASSSKGGVIAKGTAGGEAMQYNIRSMFCMSSVAVGLSRRSDQSRFTVLSMAQPPQGADGLAAFQTIQALSSRVCSGDAADRFVARSCHMAPVILKSAEVFSEAFAASKTNRRNADQIGALLAGYWSLQSDESATAEDARIIVNDIDLDGVTPESDSNDEAQFLSYLMAKRVRCEVRDPSGHASTTERTIAELIHTATNEHDRGEDATLQRYGLRCLEDGLFIANQHPGLTDLLSDTQWGVDWKRFAGRVPGAVVDARRLCGVMHRGRKIGYSHVFGE